MQYRFAVTFGTLYSYYRIRTEEKWEKYTREFDELVEQLTSQKTPVSAFILEPMSVIAGLHIPPASVIKSMFR